MSTKSFHEIPIATTCSVSTCFEQLPNLVSGFQKIQIINSNKEKKKEIRKGIATFVMLCDVANE